MFELQSVFSPVFWEKQNNSNQIGNRISVHTEDSFPDLADTKIAIIGVEEERGAVDNAGCGAAPDAVRREFYRLFAAKKMPSIADLGNLKIGNAVNDTYAVLSEVLAALIAEDIIPVVLGGSQDLTYSNYLAYEQLNRVVNITAIDPLFNLGEEPQPLQSNTYLHKIILRQPNFLFNFSNIGYQTYFVDAEEINLMEKLLFDTHRLGLAKTDLVECEPIIRNADMLSLDISAVRFSDSPGCNRVTPNGFSGEEICKLAHFAGASDKLSSFGIYEYNPLCDIANQSAMLIAEMLWYFIDGVSLRTNDMPDVVKNNFYKYFVSLHENAYEIIFYKSMTSGLWWMEIPLHDLEHSKYNRHYIVPCSHKDYLTACNNELPERWLQTYKKIQN
ncbi:MAG: formimidoylglutamase [Lentimicrobiaceae bacterium]|nr:formimidoylglutamase [Lentimicrobiaceae bacterium]